MGVQGPFPGPPGPHGSGDLVSSHFVGFCSIIAPSRNLLRVLTTPLTNYTYFKSPTRPASMADLIRRWSLIGSRPQVSRNSAHPEPIGELCLMSPPQSNEKCDLVGLATPGCIICSFVSFVGPCVSRLFSGILFSFWFLGSYQNTTLPENFILFPYINPKAVPRFYYLMELVDSWIRPGTSLASWALATSSK